MTDFSLTGIMEYLGDLLYNIVTALFYPVIWFINMIISFITDAINAFISLYNALTGLGGSITTYFSTFFTNLIPYAWLTLILLGFGIVLVLRIYHFLKDISILGNKI